MNQNNHTYDDIIELPHPTSKKHPRMAPIARAAQFAPFAALSGHDDAIYETERQIKAKPILSEERIIELNQKIAWLQEHISQKPEITVRYFSPDPRKAGGTYLEKFDVLKKINSDSKTLVFTDQTKILMEDLIEIII